MPDGSKTEKATPKRRRDERKKGHVVLSKDVVTVVSLLASFVGIRFMIPWMYQVVGSYMKECLSISLELPQAGYYDRQALLDLAKAVAMAALPILLITVLAAIISTIAQTKFLFSGESLKPNFGRMNPIKGIKNLFSGKNLVELIKNLIKIMILGVMLYQIVMGDLNDVAKTLDLPPLNSTVYVLKASFSMVLRVCMIFVAIAGFDYFYQWWSFEREMRMTKQEIKEEYKQTEGDPAVKGKIRQIQRQRAQARMMQAVPGADVIIKNPTHYAVALKYDVETDAAPILVAKGQDELALRIIRVGEENGVYIVENRPLARGIYTGTQLGEQIPEEYYGMIAEILVLVYQMNNKTLL